MTAAHAAGLSRRGLLGVLGGGAAGVALVGAGVAAAQGVPDSGTARGGARDQVVDFHGVHQAGVATSVQGHLHFAAYDVTTTDRAELLALLQDWTEAARELTRGAPIGEGGAVEGNPLAPPSDTGEAQDASAHRLTLTVGFGPSLFDDRFGLAGRRPEALVDLPAFPGDTLDPARCGGDLMVQACADDPQVAVHAIRNLSRIAAGRAAVRWAQLGYGKAASTDPDQPTPRNLFGFKDGTNNVAGDDTDELGSTVWVGDGDTASDAERWMVGGSYLVGRRIEMLIEIWDRTSLTDQEQLVGRTKGAGAPLGATAERDPVDLSAQPAFSHVAVARRARGDGPGMLRRGYNFTDGSDGLGHLDAGLFFLAYQKDVRRSFIPVQSAMARDDRMMVEYARHTGSGVWAVPPGVSETGHWGDTLLQA